MNTSHTYLFNALNTAKVMLVIGTKAEYFNAVWVKNEWSRFLALMKNDRSRLLIPCYRNMDAYDLPDELASLQSQDMSKIGFMQDLIRGVKKALETAAAIPTQSSAAAIAAPGVESLMKRGRLFLEDEDWKQATEYFDRVLDIDPEYAPAYMGRLCAELKVGNEDNLAKHKNSFDDNGDYKKAVRFADENYQEKIEGYARATNARIKAQIEEYENKQRRKLEEQTNTRERFRKLKNCIAAGGSHTVCLKMDGTVVAVGSNTYGQCNTSGWWDIVAVAAGSGHTVGLKMDGTVVAVGPNTYGQCNTSGWRDIVAIDAGNYHTVGLKSDGTVVAVGENDKGQCNTSGWRDIVAIAASDKITVGLKSDDKVVVVGDNEYNQCDTSGLGSGWWGIIAIAAGRYHTIGLRSDSTVVVTRSWSTYESATGGRHDTVATEHTKKTSRDISSWRDIVAVTAGLHIVGLKSDGTVVAVGSNYFEQCDTSGWRNIVAIDAGSHHTIGLKSDGTIVAVGKNENGRFNTYSWRDIGPPTEERLKSGAEEAQRRIAQSNAWCSQGLCSHCGGQIGGLFTKKCKSCELPLRHKSIAGLL